MEKLGLDEAIRQAGGLSALASELGVSVQTASNWRSRGRVPAEHCPAIERVTGVRCEDLRPDVPWSILREQAAPEEKEVA